MANNTNLPENETLWTGLFSGKWLLGIGLVLVLINVAVFFGIDTRPSAWLFYLNMRFWSIHMSLVLWTVAIWLALEATDIVEDYLPTIRIATVICILLVVIAALWNFLGLPVLNISFQGRSLWLDAILGIAACCVIRSIWLLYTYQYRADSIDLEEAKWFWILSGFILVALAIFGIMHIIPIKIPIHAGMDRFASVSLFTYCRNGLHELLRSGQGSFAIYAFSLLLFTTPIGFVYVIGKWIFAFMSKIRGSC